jgi:hypothetical protein
LLDQPRCDPKSPSPVDPGLLLMLYRRLPAVAAFGVIFLLYPLLYYVVVSEERYRLPIL